MVVEAVQVSLATANRFLQLARDNSRHVEEVGAGLVAVEAGLRAAIRLAQQAVGVARDAEDAANQAEDVQEEVIVRGRPHVASFSPYLSLLLLPSPPPSSSSSSPPPLPSSPLLLLLLLLLLSSPLLPFVHMSTGSAVRGCSVDGEG